MSDLLNWGYKCIYPFFSFAKQVLTSELPPGRYFAHSISNFKIGIASSGNEQQRDAIDDIKCLANKDDEESENGILKIE